MICCLRNEALDSFFFSISFPNAGIFYPFPSMRRSSLRAGPMEDEEGEDGEDGEDGEEGLDPCSLEAAQSPVPRRVRLVED